MAESMTMANALEIVDTNVKVNNSIKQAVQKMSMYPLNPSSLGIYTWKAYLCVTSHKVWEINHLCNPSTCIRLSTKYVISMECDLFKSMSVEKQGSLAIIINTLISLMIDQRQKFAWQINLLERHRKICSVCKHFIWGCTTSLHWVREFIE